MLVAEGVYRGDAGEEGMKFERINTPTFKDMKEMPLTLKAKRFHIAEPCNNCGREPKCPYWWSPFINGGCFCPMGCIWVADERKA